MDRIGKKLSIFYNDGLKVVRRDILVKDEDNNFIYDSTGHFWNKAHILRMEELN